jgi:hypothetical protein
MNQTTYAYAQGFATKLAEHGVSPADFIQVALQTRHPQFMKAAEYLYAGIQMEKHAAWQSQLGDISPALQRRFADVADVVDTSVMPRIAHGMGDDMTDVIPHTQISNARLQQMLPEFSAPRQAPPTPAPAPLPPGARVFRGPDGPLNAAEAAPMFNDMNRSKLRNLAFEQQAPEPAAVNPWIRRAQIGGGVAGGAGLIGAGIYGAGDADTLGNQARGFSNDNLGTDLNMQSRFGRLAEKFDTPQNRAAVQQINTNSGF